MPAAFLNNPFLFGAVAVIAAGIIIYELLNRQKNTNYSSGSGSGNPRSPPPHSPKKYEDIKKDIPLAKPRSRDTDSDKSDSSLRKRNIDQSPLNQSSGTKPKHFAETQNDFKKDSIHQPSATKNESSATTNGNIDKKFDEKKYEKNVLDKIINDTKDVNKVVKKDLIKNIDSEDSDSSESNLPEESKKIGKKLNNNPSFYKLVQVSNASNDQSFESQSVSSICTDEGCDPLSSLDSETCISSISDSEEGMYKKKVQEALKDDLDYDNKGKSHIFAAAPGCSYECNPNENPLSIESKKCKGCEENNVNTRARPCNHSYLCLDCAVRVFRIYKKCTVCHERVLEFVSF